MDSIYETTRECIKKFLDSTCSSHDSVSGYLTNVTAFTRKGKLSVTDIAVLGLHQLKGSYSAELPLCLGQLLNGLCGEAAEITKSAYSQKRKLLRPEFFNDWASDIAANAYRLDLGWRRWRGFRVMAMDGTTVQLLDTKDNADHFGRWKNDAGEQVPIAKIVLLCDLLNTLVLKTDIGGEKRNERNACFDLVDYLSVDDLLVMDRGYPSFWLFYLLEAMQVKFIIRVPKSFSNSVKEFVESGESEGSILSCATSKSVKLLKEKGMDVKRDTPMKLRIVKFTTPGGADEYLVTNLGSVDYPAPVIAEGYMLRWKVEIDIFYLKDEQQWCTFSGYLHTSILQDLFAATAVFNIVSLFSKICEVQTADRNKRLVSQGKRPLVVDRNVCTGITAYYLIGIFYADMTQSEFCIRNIIGITVQGMVSDRRRPDRPRNIRMKRIRGKYWTDMNFKDEMHI